MFLRLMPKKPTLSKKRGFNLMSLTSSKLLKVEHKPIKKNYQPSRNPNACNPTYLRPLNVGCSYCTDKSGRKKNYGNLYRLYTHFCHHHSNQPRYKELIMSLADFLLDGTLL